MKKLIALAVLTSVIAIPAAHAQETDTHSVTVRYADLNVGSRAGVDALQERVKAAARIACGSRPDARELAQGTDYKACLDKASDDAMQTVHAPLVASTTAKTLPVGTN